MIRKVSRSFQCVVQIKRNLCINHLILNNKMEPTTVNKPHWTPPTPTSTSFRTGLKINNSLVHTEELVEFIPLEGRRVNWYCCGPTVYSLSHLGHARCYIVNDYVRRLLKDYLNYDVFV